MSTTEHGADEKETRPSSPPNANNNNNNRPEFSSNDWADVEKRPSSALSRTTTGSSRDSADYALHHHETHPDTDLERRRTANSEVLSRTETQRQQHAGTVGEEVWSRPDTTPLPAFGGGKDYPPPLPARDQYVVDFDGPDDPTYPQNWPLWKKVYISAMLAYTSICSTFDSAIFGGSSGTLSQYFHVGTEVAELSSTLYIIGYASGPLIWAPFSELRGRRLPIIISMLGFGIFNTGVATGKDIQTVMICRFFAGIFGSCPLAVVAAIFSDMYNNRTRGSAIAVFSSTVFLGPLLAPFISGFINMSYLKWRWTAYIPSFMGYFAFAINLLFLKESYAPVVLIDKAVELRRRTKNWGIHAKQEEIEVDFRQLLIYNFSRPVRMLISEPVILAVTVYLSFIYGLLYCFLAAFPLVFQEVYHFNAGESGLTLFGIVVGLLMGGTFIIWTASGYNKKLDAHGGVPVPEWRLPPVILGGALFAIGLFWFGWTGFTKRIHWLSPTFAGVPVGFGLLVIFVQLFNYLIDTYLAFAASAIAANTFCRSALASSFPLFTRQMFNNMHIQFACTLLGCVASVLVPIPVIFYLFGRKLRMKSKFAPYNGD